MHHAIHQYGKLLTAALLATAFSHQASAVPVLSQPGAAASYAADSFQADIGQSAAGFGIDYAVRAVAQEAPPEHEPALISLLLLGAGAITLARRRDRHAPWLPTPVA